MSVDKGSSAHDSEIDAGERFAFGENWKRFLSVVDERRIEIARQALADSLGVSTLEGKRFLDIGSGSGLSSLAARRLGAEVLSFDYDPASVACTRELRRYFAPDDKLWHVEQGSALDKDFVATLGTWDIVYSWGVLHHTGDLYGAMDNVVPLVAEGGTLLIAIYNDQGGQSRRWHRLKKLYNTLPGPLRMPYAIAVMGPREARFLALSILSGRPRSYFSNIRHYADRSLRGMSYWHDLVDWIGGYPFQVAKPETIFAFYRDRNFRLENLTTVGGTLACNEYVFIRDGPARHEATATDLNKTEASAQ